MEPPVNHGMKSQKSADGLPFVSILISNWNGAELTDKCISSLLEVTDYPKHRFNIIVVDDGSTDNSDDFLVRKYAKRIDLVALGSNVGFIKANNAGIRYILEKYGPEYILLLNNDTLAIQKDWLRNLVETAEQDNKVGTVGAKLIFPDGRIQWSGRRKETNSLFLVFQTISAGFNPGVGKDEKGADYARFIGEANTASGACMLVRTELFTKIGLLDERLAPMFGEDVEYSFRAWKSGYKVIYRGDVNVVHYESYTIEKFKKELQSKKLYWSLRNSAIVSKTYFGFWRTLSIGLPILALAALLDKKDKSAGLRIRNMTLRQGFPRNIVLLFKAIRVGLCSAPNTHERQAAQSLFPKPRAPLPKVAILTPTFYNSGISRIVTRQASAVARRGSKVVIFAFAGNVKPPESVTLQLMGMPRGFLVEKLFYWTFPLNLTKAIKCVPRLREFDVIIAHLYPMTCFAYWAKKLYGTKYIYHNHGFLQPVGPSQVSFLERIYMKINLFMHTRTIKSVDGAISVSQHARRQLRNLTGLDSEVIYNSVNLEEFHKGLDRSKIRAKHRLGNAPTVLYVGTILPNKGVDTLVKAHRLIKHKVPDVKLMLVGQHIYPAYSKRIKQMADDSVMILGELPHEELPYYYTACDVYASASVWESFNLPLVEAQACGRPVVAFDIGPHPEVIEHGKTGFLIPPGNINALAKTITQLLKDGQLRHEMGENAYEMMKERFSLDGFVVRTCDFISRQ